MISYVVLYVSGALGFSFLCSILEAALLSTRTTELIQRKEAGDRGAAALLDIKQNRVDDAISAILTLNTIAHTVGATLAGAEFAEVTNNRWLGLFSGLLTLAVLVITEIIPKTLGTVHASRLVGFVARVLGLLMKLLAPLLMITRVMTRLISHGHAETVSRGELAALVAMAAQQGTLEGQEQRVLGNMLKFEQVRVSDVMTPRTVVFMLPEATSVGELLKDPKLLTFSRIPLYKEDRDHVTGYVLLKDVLRAAAEDEDPATPLTTYRRDVERIPGSMSLADALSEGLQRREHMTMVADEFGGINGLVTLEDIVETILGVEIVDESDRDVDMRQAALKLRDQRLTRRQGRTDEEPAEPPAAEEAAE